MQEWYFTNGITFTFFSPFLENLERPGGQQFNLTGSPKIPVLGEEFNWTCEAFVPPAERSADVFFYRNSYSSVLAAVIGSKCYTFGRDPRYIIECLSESTFTLTIPAENMTEYEQNSIWSCRSSGNLLYRSPEFVLNIESLGPPYVPPNLDGYHFVVENTNLSVNCGAADKNATSVVFWEKLSDDSFKQNGTTMELLHALRNSSGIYKCNAENFYSNGDKKTSRQYIHVKVLYEPSVSSLNNQTILEGENLSLTCNVTAGYPRSSVIFWTKTDDPSFRFNGKRFTISRIQRSSSGTYGCTAENYYNSLGKGSSSQIMTVNVLYPPLVHAPDEQRVIEGANLAVNCNVMAGNPSFFIVYWTKLDDPLYRKDGAILQLLNIQRNSSGTYICIAENYINESYMGVANQSMHVDVLYPPSIEETSRFIVNESQKIALSFAISSNPLSNVSWYSGAELLKVETSVETATLTIEKALCTDTKNFTLIASNGMHINATFTVELIVNCKPHEHRNITLGIADEIGIEFSTTIIAYPEPQYVLKYINGTTNTNMARFIFRNAINNFTISYTKKTVLQSDFGIYVLEIMNSFGISRIFIEVIPRWKPSKPRDIEASCLVTQAKIRWTSSFNGGSKQTFTVTSLNDGFESGWSSPIPDRGSNIIHETYIGYLQPSKFYEFYVSAKNMHGITKSNRTSCTTMAVLYLPEAPSTEALSYEVKIAIGSFGGSLVFTTMVVLAIVIVRRYKCSCMIEFRRRNKEGKEESTQEENENHYEELTGKYPSEFRNIFDIRVQIYPEEMAEKTDDSSTKDEDSSTGQSVNKQVTEILGLVQIETETKPSKYNVNRIHSLGDELNKHKLFKNPKIRWDDVKEGRMSKPELFLWLRENSEKSFSTREIYMTWVKEWDREVFLRIHKEEINYIMNKLNKRTSYKTAEWFNSNKMIVQDGAEMLDNLSFAFGDRTTVEMKIRQEIKKHRVHYNEFDNCSKWITEFLNQESPDTWNPFVFYICANAFRCTVCIVVSGREEYRIHSLEQESHMAIVHFGIIGSSQYVYLRCNRKVFDALNIFRLSSAKFVDDSREGEFDDLVQDISVKMKMFAKKIETCAANAKDTLVPQSLSECKESIGQPDVIKKSDNHLKKQSRDTPTKGQKMHEGYLFKKNVSPSLSRPDVKSRNKASPVNNVYNVSRLATPSPFKGKQKKKSFLKRLAEGENASDVMDNTVEVRGHLESSRLPHSLPEVDTS
ncbi:uncharacterized protein LOC134265101 [Saccostrea cucullata]|uniref:uncharacterized protein LOC134265101 n=1 Tax=Saccostrea cuccullata TaxID=36930 RepID=UPI002ED0897D